MVRPAGFGHARNLQGDEVGQLARDLREPLPEASAGRGEPLHGDEGDRSRPMVDVEHGVGGVQDLGVVLDKGARPVQALLLAVPERAEDRAARVRDRRLQNAHRLHDGDRAGAVVERPGRTVPGVVVAAEDHELLGVRGARDLREGVEDGHLTEEFGPGVHPQHRLLAVLGQPIDQSVRLATQVEDRGLLHVGAEDLVHAPAFGPLRADNPGGPGGVQ